MMKRIFRISVIFVFTFIFIGCNSGGADNSPNNPSTSKPAATANFLIVGQQGLINNLTNEGIYTNVSMPNVVILDITKNSEGKFVAVGRDGVIMTSINGVNWHLEKSGVDIYLNSVAVNSHGKFVAVGNSGTILSSLNGTNWKIESSGTTIPLNGHTITHKFN